MSYKPPHIVFDCEVLTPMFLGGAEKNTFRLSASSVRGALRYWYRALLGGMGYTSPEVAVQEALVFGSVGNNDVKGSKSPLEIVVMEGDDFSISSSRDEYDEPIDLFRTNTGKGYLWFTAAFGKDNDQNETSINNLRFAKPGSKFKIAFIANQFRAGSMMPTPTITLWRSTYPMWALANFGGLGSRSRHGAGNFVINNVTSNLPGLRLELMKFNEHPASYDDFINKFKTTINFLKSQRAIFGTPAIDQPSNDFDTLHENTQIIAPTDYTSTDPLEAAEFIGKKIQKFRKGTQFKNQPFCNQIKNETSLFNSFVKKTQRERRYTNLIATRAKFGLPFTLKFGNTILNTNLYLNNKPKRRATPLLVKIIRTNENNSFKYIPILIHLDSAFKSNNHSIKVSIKSDMFNATLSDFDPIQELLTRINEL